MYEDLAVDCWNGKRKLLPSTRQSPDILLAWIHIEKFIVAARNLLNRYQSLLWSFRSEARTRKEEKRKQSARCRKNGIWSTKVYKRSFFFVFVSEWQPMALSKADCLYFSLLGYYWDNNTQRGHPLDNRGSDTMECNSRHSDRKANLVYCHDIYGI